MAHPAAPDDGSCFAFFYLMLHFTTYAVLDASLDLAYVVEDVADRLYITAGFRGFRDARAPGRDVDERDGAPASDRCGGAGCTASCTRPGSAGCLHYLWLVKADLREPLVYAGILAILLAARLPVVVKWMQARRSKGRRKTRRAVGVLTVSTFRVRISRSCESPDRVRSRMPVRIRTRRRSYDTRTANPSRDAARFNCASKQTKPTLEGIAFCDGQRGRELEAVRRSQRMHAEQPLRPDSDPPARLYFRTTPATTQGGGRDAPKPRSSSGFHHVPAAKGQRRNSTGAPPPHRHPVIPLRECTTRFADAVRQRRGPQGRKVSQKFTGRLPAILPSVRRAGLPEPRPPSAGAVPSTSRGVSCTATHHDARLLQPCKLRILVHAVRLYPALRVKPYRDDARNRCSALRDQYRFTRFDSTKIGAHAVLDLGNRRSDHLVSP